RRRGRRGTARPLGDTEEASRRVHDLLEELVEEQDDRRRHFEAGRGVEDRDRAAGCERPPRPELDDVLQEQTAREQRGDADGGEEDELLSERVETAIVEDNRRDDVRDVSFVARNVVEDPAVLALEVAERRQPREAPDEQRGEHRARRGEEAETDVAAHSRRRSRSFASAASTMNGNATVEATSSDRATSGAWST